MNIPEYWRWFSQARYGLFIHFGAYARDARGEQVLFRELIDQRDYARRACAWTPKHLDLRQWASIAKDAGFGYAVLTTRHHDGYCLWDTKTTDYNTARQAAGRDVVREYVDAFRAAGLRVGLYYSLADWRIKAYWQGPKHNQAAFDVYRDDIHEQVRELVSSYGMIDVLWFDGAWPHNANTWQSPRLIDMIRSHQPHILINNRLGELEGHASGPGNEEAVGLSRKLGDFGTPEHHITADASRLWESCNTSTWRLWGHAAGERWRSADQLLDMLVDAVSKGGNLLLNVGPDAHGRFPKPFVRRARQIGDWLRVHDEAIRHDHDAAGPGEVCEFITFGRQIRRGNHLYLVIRFWPRKTTLAFAGLKTPVRRATLVTTNQPLDFRQTDTHVTLMDLPRKAPTALFPVIRLDFDQPPTACDWAKDRLWTGDASRMAWWAQG